MKRILSLTAIILLLATTQVCCHAQNKKVHNVIGRCEITRELSLAQAEERALEDAKINAMRKAGVSERLWSVTGLINEDDGSEFSQVLSRMTTLEINGLITVRALAYSEQVIDGRRYAVATIDADVKLVDTKVDLTFQMEVNGIKGVYESGDDMTFTVKLYGHDAWLRVFWFDDNGGMLLYPSSYDNDATLRKDKEYTFPLNPSIEYVMEKLDKSHKMETINIIAVATKRDIPFLEDEVTFDTVLKWLYTIPADERVAYREAIIIQ